MERKNRPQWSVFRPGSRGTVLPLDIRQRERLSDEELIAAIEKSLQ